MIDATTEIHVGLDRRGTTALRRLSCEVPLLVRVLADTGPTLALALVGGAAGPIGGDRLLLRLEVDAGARVSVCSVAAAMAQPGPRGDASELSIEIAVGAGATLDWCPQPTISVAGSDHRSTVMLWATSTSRVTMREGVSLGRHGEQGGQFALHERVTIDGLAVLDHEVALAPGPLLGPGAHGQGHCMTSEVVIRPDLPDPHVHVDDRCLSSTVHLSPVCALTTTRS